MSRTSIWLDCDTGHDDAFAILLAAHHSKVRLLGISTVYGNSSLENTTYNSRAILEAIGRRNVSVYPGASRPLVRDPVHAPDIHGASGLDGTTYLPVPQDPSPLAKHIPAVDAMRKALLSEPTGTPWLVATGALTNIATLFAKYPDLREHIAGLSIMGGAIGGGFTNAPLGTVEGQGERFGNYSPFAEFNIYIDPEAADAIFSDPVLSTKTTLIPLDLTHQFLATTEVQFGLLFGFDKQRKSEPTMQDTSRVRRLFCEILTFFKRTYAEVFGLTTGAPTHDPLAVAIAFAPELFKCTAQGRSPSGEEAGLDLQEERFHVKVVTEGEQLSTDLTSNTNSTSQLGRTVVTLLPPGSVGVRIPRGLDVWENWAMIESCLSRAEQTLRRSTAIP